MPSSTALVANVDDTIDSSLPSSVRPIALIESLPSSTVMGKDGDDSSILIFRFVRPVVFGFGVVVVSAFVVVGVVLVCDRVDLVGPVVAFYSDRALSSAFFSSSVVLRQSRM